MPAAEHSVVIAGAGPTGMMLAAELALARVDVVVLERRGDHEVLGARARGFGARTAEILDQRGVVDRFLEGAERHPVVMFGGRALEIGDLPTRHPYTVGLAQREFERIMAGWLATLAVTIRHGNEIVGVAQDDRGVEVELAGGERVRGRYLVGCDGGRSLVRRQAGIAFPGSEATRSNLIAEAVLVGAPERDLRHDENGVHGLQRLADGRRTQVVVTEPRLGRGDAPSLGELRDALAAAYGTDFDAHDPTWISRFTDAARQAEAYRAGRILLAGDAAHIHYPTGGQGLSLGVQDAVNLGFKLARVVTGSSPEILLDSYHRERHPVGARVLRQTMAQSALQRRDAQTQAVVDELAELTRLDEPRRAIGASMSGLDIRYDLGDDHPLLGRRMPDLDLVTEAGPCRLYELLHDAAPVLLDLGGRRAPALLAERERERLRLVAASCAPVWELPAIGAVEAPDGVLIRPDGHVAWVGLGDDAGLAAALATWC